MDPNSISNPNHQILREFPPWLRVYKDGRVERFMGTETTAAGTHPLTGVQSKDITIDPQTGLSARLFLPKIASRDNKLPLLIYTHGGAFCVCTAFHPFYHDHLNTLAAQANVVVVSVDYRLAPEHPLPIAYDDTWAAIQWASAHSNGNGPEPWLNNHADFRRVYFAGDSAGANIAHNMAMRVGSEGLPGSNLTGIVLVHPFFGNERKDELMEFLFPTMSGLDDPKINPAKDPNLRRLGCRRVMVMVAEKDFLRDRGRNYYEAMKKSGWEGELEMAEAEAEELGHDEVINVNVNDEYGCVPDLGSDCNKHAVNVIFKDVDPKGNVHFHCCENIAFKEKPCFDKFVKAQFPYFKGHEPSEVAQDLSPLAIVYKDGRVLRLLGNDVVPPSFDPETNVLSKDVVVSHESAISVRIYLPKIAQSDPTRKLPLLVYFHGGGFVIETASSPTYHNYLNDVVSASNVVAVSVDYRLAPEHPVPIAHEDSWTSLRWIASHAGGNGSEEFLNRHADLDKVFFAGDSAGANLAHHMAIRVGSDGLPGLKLEGIVLIHPYFWGSELIGSEKTRPAEERSLVERIWRVSCPTTEGSDDPIINPEKDPKVGKMGCKRVLVCVAEKDLFKERGWNYKEVMEKEKKKKKKGEWDGSVEVMEAKGENHVFHLMNLKCDNAVAMLNRIVSFIHQN
ncbi:putative carboxylesterase 12 [Senna tora]|uniref:Putative carboxylesterase 12 n=1 Tax=Senna tora TaxID=362788 RepID=A0A834SXU4_9FABA|nr:putative carboxylesterase 12 [Senna tora]